MKALVKKIAAILTLLGGIGYGLYVFNVANRSERPITYGFLIFCALSVYTSWNVISDSRGIARADSRSLIGLYLQRRRLEEQQRIATLERSP